MWKIDKLLEVIKKEVAARESSELKSQGNKPFNGKFHQRQDASTANSLFTSDCKPHCVYCHAEHYSASCTEVCQAKDRKEILRKAGPCFVCLKTNYKSRECNSSKNCRHCTGKHHQSICDRVANTRTPTPDQKQIISPLQSECCLIMGVKYRTSLSIFVQNFPVLCSALPSRINIDCPHLEGLDLADDWDQTDGSIDLLIGLDHHWDIVTGETRTREMGPVTVKSSLSWLLSEPCPSLVHQTTTWELITT